MSGVCPRGEEGEQQQLVLNGGGGVSGRGSSCLSGFYHVPQQCRREKLRYSNAADERPPWQPHTTTASGFPPAPLPSLFHCDAPLSTAVRATATASFMPPSPSSHVLSPAGYLNAAPYDHGFTPVHLLDHHPLFGGTSDRQGVSLSLYSAGSPSQHHGPVVHTPAVTAQLPLASAAPRVGPVPAGPFTGYATILQGSRFLRPAQQLLEEVCGGGGDSTAAGAMVCSRGETESLEYLAAKGVGECGDMVDGLTGDGEHRRFKSKLISMLDEVCRRYKQYYQQIQAVVTSFQAVAGLNTAAPYTPLALRSLSKHFRCLKNAISDQLRLTNKGGQSKDEMPGYGLMNGGIHCQRVAQSSGAINQQPVWRPQRGLPERAVSVLRAWLFEHFLHPYPTDMDKQLLAKQTGLSRNQVSNWFINARVRLWKPMVEEIHSLELQQARNTNPENDIRHDTNEHPEFSSASTPADRQTPPTINFQRNPNQPQKRFRDELSQLPNNTMEPINFSLDNVSAHHRVGVPMGFAGGATNGDVSLTLGLHQNGGVCLSEPFPLNVVQRFGLEDTSVGYVMGGLEGHDRHFAREFDGQLLHHFVA